MKAFKYTFIMIVFTWLHDHYGINLTMKIIIQDIPTTIKQAPSISLTVAV